MPPFQRQYGTLDPVTGLYALSPNRQAITTAILSAGSFAGALLGTPTANFIGRRGSIFLAGAVFMLGVILQVAVLKLGVFLAGRFIAGAGVGALSALVPLYVGEVR